MAYRNKTYVCFDGDNDIKHYNLMKAWKENDNVDFDFHNAHDINNLWNGSNEDTIKRRLRERLNNTKLLIVLVGESTKNLYRFVRWEIEMALNMEIPIIAVNIINDETRIYDNFPPLLRNELVINVQFRQSLIRYSIDNWIAENELLKGQNIKNNRVWVERIYKELGLK